LFEKNISARKFSESEVTPFRSNNFEVVSDSAALKENIGYTRTYDIRE
jgi:SP family general alpha glucoside:H+ symporter-like MFS transporter